MEEEESKRKNKMEGKGRDKMGVGSHPRLFAATMERQPRAR
jgi:hypothetical protein